MTNVQKQMFRFSFVLSGLIALFWAIWYFKTGSVPVDHRMFIFEIPFGISRWWDILIGPVFCIPLVLVFNHKVVKEYDMAISPTIILGSMLVIGLFICPMNHTPNDDTSMLFAVVGIGFACISCLYNGLEEKPIVGIYTGQLAFLSAGLAIGLSRGFWPGLVFILVASVAIWPAVGLVYLIKSKPVAAIRKWLTAK